jgi:hypothetical protein
MALSGEKTAGCLFISQIPLMGQEMHLVCCTPLN